MEMRIAGASVALAIFGAAIFAPLTQAGCPENIRDCQNLIGAPSSATSDSLELTAGSFTLVARLVAGTSGADGAVHLLLYSTSNSAPPANIVIDMMGATGLTWVKNQDGSEQAARFALRLDPGSGIRPEGTFPYNDAAGPLAIPIILTVTRDDGTQAQKAGVLTQSEPASSGFGGSMLTLGALFVGIVVGVVAALAMKRKK
jgi:hypothetical protein